MSQFSSRPGASPPARYAAPAMALRAITPSVMEMSIYCPSPVAARLTTAARIPITALLEPEAMSAIWIPMRVGPVAFRPE